MNQTRLNARGALSFTLCLGVLAVAAPLGGCGVGDSAEGAQGSYWDQDDATVVATVGDVEVTLGDVRSEIDGRLKELEFNYRKERHDLLESALNNLVQRSLLEAEATRRGITLDELVEQETGDAIEVSDERVESFFRQNEEALGGQSLEQLAPQIRDYLIRRQRERILRNLAVELAQDVEVNFMLEPVRADFDLSGSPSYGPDDSRVTLVEFSDFECPYCGRFFPTLQRIKEEYGDRIRIVYLQFPLSELHPHAWKAAEASLCAHEQGRFWDMHDMLFEEQEALAVEDLKEKASRLNLDRESFDACLDSGRTAEKIRSDMQQGEIHDVTGTPAIFINGVQVEGGAVPYQVIAQRIDAELARSGGE